MPGFLETTFDKFIFRVADDRLYSEDGVWALAEAGRVRIGLTDYVQQRNGDVAFVHLKPAGSDLAPGDEFVELETIKTTVSFAAPVGGVLVELNPNLSASPEFINEEPYGKGWLAVIDAANWPVDKGRLLDPKTYLALVRRQAEEEANG